MDLTEFLRSHYEDKGWTVREIAALLDVSRATAHRYLAQLGIKLRRRGPRKSFGRKLDAVKVGRIRRRLAAGESQVAVARAMRVSRQAVSAIARGKTWVGVGVQSSNS